MAMYKEEDKLVFEFRDDAKARILPTWYTHAGIQYKLDAIEPKNDIRDYNVLTYREMSLI